MPLPMVPAPITPIVLISIFTPIPAREVYNLPGNQSLSSTLILYFIHGVGFASGFCQLNDVLYFQNLPRIAFADSVDHSQPHFLQSTKARRVKCFAHGVEPGKKLVITFHIFLAPT